MAEACASVGDASKVRMVTRKMLKGHINKVNSVHYSGDNRWGRLCCTVGDSAPHLTTLFKTTDFCEVG